MSQDDLNGIKNQIHSKINKIVEKYEEEDEGKNQNQNSLEDDEGQVILERLKKRRPTLFWYI